MALATLLTDFGTRDYYVAAVKGVLLCRCPEARLVDISHDVEPGDIGQGTFLLTAAAPSFPAGTVHLAVVDPGVGSRRRMLAVRAREQLFVAPDNGLLSPWLGEGAVHSIERPDLYRSAPGSPFHGRDRFAPAAAFLLGGGDIRELGPAIGDGVRSPQPPVKRQPRRLSGSVVHIDRFGNLVTDLPASWLEDRFLEARIGGHACRRQVACYAELSPGEPGLLVGSLSTLELSLDGVSLARAWSVQVGAEVEIVLRPKPRGSGKKG